MKLKTEVKKDITALAGEVEKDQKRMLRKTQQ